MRAFGTTLTVVSLLWTGTVRGQESILLHHLDTTAFVAIAESAGYSVQPMTERRFALQRGDMRVWEAKLDDCDDAGRCKYLRLRHYWRVGTRPESRATVAHYVQTVPIAFVAIYEDGEETFAAAGRDVWLSGGRTRENIKVELSLTDSMGAALTGALLSGDPGIAEFWKSHEGR